MTDVDLTTTDLRELAEQHLGKPLAASANAGLWRCPVCPPERHALLMVSADEYKCLSGYPCDGGASEWMSGVDPEPNQPLMIGVPA
jgi:hypothetical protein